MPQFVEGTAASNAVPWGEGGAWVTSFVHGWRRCWARRAPPGQPPCQTNGTVVMGDGRCPRRADERLPHGTVPTVPGMPCRPRQRRARAQTLLVGLAPAAVNRRGYTRASHLGAPAGDSVDATPWLLACYGAGASQVDHRRGAVGRLAAGAQAPAKPICERFTDSAAQGQAWRCGLPDAAQHQWRPRDGSRAGCPDSRPVGAGLRPPRPARCLSFLLCDLGVLCERPSLAADCRRGSKPANRALRFCA
jgi:hypothetical protein